MKRARCCPNDAKLHMPKRILYARLLPVEDTYKDPGWKERLKRSLKRRDNILFIEQDVIETGVSSSRNFLTWSRLVEALDLANFDDNILMLSSTADAWKPLPRIFLTI